MSTGMSEDAVAASVVEVSVGDADAAGMGWGRHSGCGRGD
jgi:hypothetical protein